MSLKTKIQKIFSVALLCFVLVSLMPIHVFAGSTSAFTGFNKVKPVPAMQTIIDTGALTETIDTKAVNLASVDPATKGITQDQISALAEARKAAGAPDFATIAKNAGVNPSTGNTFTVADQQGNVSYYYQESEAKDAKRILLAQVSDGKVYIPPNGFVPKAGTESDNNTDIGTEQGFKNAIDVDNNRPSGTTYQKLVNADQFEQNKQTQATDQAKLDAINKQLADNQTNDTLSAQEQKDLENQRDQLQSKINSNAAKIQDGANTLAPGELKLDVCPTGISEIGKFFTSSCIVTIFAMVANITLKLSSFVLYIVGILFDYSIEITVNSAQFIKALAIVEPTWVAIRDFLNMTFIFVLVYIAWQILLGNSNYNAKTSVARLVLVAILINFSLFAAKLMVDSSNILSLNIYQAMKAPVAPGSSNQANASEVDQGSVSARIMTTLGLTSIFNFSDAFNNKTIPGCGTVPSTILTVGVFGTILILITSMTFLLAAVLFFLRMLNIVVLFVTSPIWVWGYVIQNADVKKYSDKWLSNMLHVMRFPIMYMMILYVSLAMFAQLSNSQGAQRPSFIQVICNTAITGTGGSGLFAQLPVVINFIVVIACLMGAIAYSIKHGDKSPITGKFASNITGKFDNFSKKITTGAAQGLYNKTAGAAAFAGRNTLALAKTPITAGKFLAREGGYKIAKGISNLSGAAAVGLSNVSPKAATAFAMLSNKTKDPSILGEKKEEGYKRRTKKVTERADILNKVQMEQTKIVSREDFTKNDKSGKTYDEYLDKQVEIIEDLQIGKLKDATGKDGKVNKDILREGIYDEEKDKDGNVIGKKINQDRLFKNIETIKEFHTKDGSLFAQEKSKRWGLFLGESTKARMESSKKVLKSRVIGKEKSIEDKEKKIEKLRQEAQKLPDDLDKVAFGATDEELAKYDKKVQAYANTNTDQETRDKLKEEVEKRKEEIENQIEKLFGEIEKAKEKKDKEAESKKK